MSELDKIFLTSSLTVAGGAITLVVGQIIQKFLLEPVHEQAKAIGETLFCLTYYASWYANPGHGRDDDLTQASNAIRESASQLKATTNAVVCYRLFAAMGLAPRKENAERAVGNLISISNSVHSGDGRDNRKDASDVYDLLARGKRQRVAPRPTGTSNGAR